VTEEVLVRHAASKSALQNRLDRLRSEAEALAADVEARNQIIERELRQAAPRVADFDLPEPYEADEWEDPLFDSDREYIAQIDRYKAFQGKPTERREHGTGYYAKTGQWAKIKARRTAKVAAAEKAKKTARPSAKVSSKPTRKPTKPTKPVTKTPAKRPKGKCRR
jgi:hypothetical protein